MATQRWGDSGLPWSGNSTLAACALSGNTVVLDYNRPAVIAATKGLWRMNEASWAGTAGEVLDASGLGHHGQAYGGATTAEGWMNQAGSFSGSNYALVPAHEDLRFAAGEAATFEVWFRGNPTTTKLLCGWYNVLNSWDLRLLTTSAGGSLRWRRSDTGDGVTLTPTVSGTYNDNNWHHLAVVTWVDGGTRYAQAFADGVAGTALSGVEGSQTTNCAFGFGGRWDDGSLTLGFAGLLDEAHWCKSRLYTGAFSPVRFQASGTVVCANNTLAGTLTGVSWGATESGDNEGDISKVEVWTDGAWTQVGGDSPTSPLAGLVLPVAAGNLLRFTLAPKADAKQSETPVLTWAEATVQGATAGYYSNLLANRQGRY